MMLDLNLEVVSTESMVPKKLQFKKWIETVLMNNKIKNAEIGIRIVDEMESAHINKLYRLKKGPTNVLSFVLHHPIDKTILIGDLIFCAPLIHEEAKKQNKSPIAHWAHLAIHGTLHLIG